ncbi:MAG: ABC transporter permease [Candidatus Hadarchaeum sp.]|uniref:ABC transporter permease n=1 Tax=Candidatus Hadarchaeum sp. TaxID=2883567 RepID=UPI00317ED8A6
MLINELVSVTLRQSAPLMFSAYGGAFTYHVGAINIAMEAEILLSAFASIVVTAKSGSVFLGAISAMLSAVLVGLLFSFLTEKLLAHIVTVALGLNTLAFAITRLLMWMLGGTRGVLAPENLPMLPTLSLPRFERVPVIGGMTGHTVLVYFAWVACLITTLILYFTKLGLRIRAVGENTEAARATGINTLAVRVYAQMLCGVFCGLAGAQLALGDLRLFTSRISAGKGFIALAAIYFGRGRPALMTFACLIFGFFDGLQSRLQLWAQVPPQMAQALPFVTVVFALVIISYLATRKRESVWREQK